jgi:hypothetical protein
MQKNLIPLLLLVIALTGCATKPIAPVSVSGKTVIFRA